ncbi:hypothetical protein tb265_26230 [Gemmatimonadetes bacterium T265]|nr:hypothetical protein tb265_26230 [Gemmatimonadetes bacterium T265]
MSIEDSPVVLDVGATVHLARGDGYGAELDRRFALLARRVAPLISAVSVGEVLRVARRQRQITRAEQVTDEAVQQLLSNLNVVPAEGAVALEFARLSAALDDAGNRLHNSAKVWVAATAAATRGVVVTDDVDFRAFGEEVRCEIVDAMPFLEAE